MYPILVTGSPRSGTSWIGKMISLSSQIGYLPETYNVLIMENLPGEPLPNQFGIQADLESNLVEEDFTKIIQFRYSFRDLITRNKSFPNLINSIITHFRFRSFRRKNLVPLLKDPYMIFSTDWLFEKFGVRPLILIRHPGPILDSYKRLNWEIDFDHIYDHLKNEELKQVIASSGILSNKLPSRPIQIAVLWNLIHKQITIYQERYPEWLFLRYE
ncbi:MAG: hypothetical protein ACXAE3_17705, partial [Candidatus Kariarchaeaceae archaeon]